jgi:carbamoyl-phosphate synthase large subunit
MALEKGGVKCERVLKIQEGRPNAGDMLKNGEISMLLLTTTGKRNHHSRAATLIRLCA